MNIQSFSPTRAYHRVYLRLAIVKRKECAL
jgi:hypothetical protein